eukprot:scaffold136362_cov46-Prasinocladus_malaysianus.AAC.1
MVIKVHRQTKASAEPRARPDPTAFYAHNSGEPERGSSACLVSILRLASTRNFLEYETERNGTFRWCTAVGEDDHPQLGIIT